MTKSYISGLELIGLDLINDCDQRQRTCMLGEGCTNILCSPLVQYRGATQIHTGLDNSHLQTPIPQSLSLWKITVYYKKPTGGVNKCKCLPT